MQFQDRALKCSDCGNDFVFTAGEQLFFHDKQFKNDPKRCKLCKARRAGASRTSAAGVSALPLSRTETRTECSACGVETTVPFKPTQGRPVLCRSCFQLKRLPSAVAQVIALDSPEAQVEAQLAALTEQMTPSADAASPLQAIAELPAAALASGATESQAEALALGEEPVAQA